MNYIFNGDNLYKYFLIFMYLTFSTVPLFSSELVGNGKKTLNVSIASISNWGDLDYSLKGVGSFSVSSIVMHNFLQEYNVLSEYDFSYSMFKLNNVNSILNMFNVSAGLLYYYSWYKYFSPYVGFSLGTSVFYFDAENQNRKIVAVKPFLGCNTGFFINYSRNISFRVKLNLNTSFLSQGTMLYSNIGFGVTYRLNNTHEFEKSEVDVIALMYDRAKELLSRGSVFDAKSLFDDISQKSPNYKKQHKYSMIIDTLINQYNVAVNQSNSGKTYLAMNSFLSLAPKMAVAMKQLLVLRNSLIGQLPYLEKKAVENYESKKYKMAIFYFKRILLIDPNNKTAKMFLSRAVKKQQAIDILR